MLFAHSHEGGAMRWVAKRLHREELARHIDLRAAYDFAVVFATLLIGALLWLALARPMPAKSNRVDVTKNCVFPGRAGSQCSERARDAQSEAEQNCAFLRREVKSCLSELSSH